jgi:hypothetical protein
MTGRVEDADEAIKEFDRVDLADNPFLLNMHEQALLVAVHAAGLDRTARNAYWKRAAEIDARLARFPDAPIAVQGRFWYYYATGDDDTLLEVIRAGKKRIEKPIENWGFDVEWEVLYRRKQFDQALAAIPADRSLESSTFLARAVVLATLGRTAEAERLLLDILRGPRGGANFGLFTGYLNFLGPGATTDPRRVARDLLEQSPPVVPTWRNGWYRDVLRFNAGQIDAAALAEKAGASRFNQCEGYFYIGLRCLYERDRAGAKQWFTKSVATGVFDFGEYLGSRAFLACIDDPAWLPWCR